MAIMFVFIQNLEKYHIRNYSFSRNTYRNVKWNIKVIYFWNVFFNSYQIILQKWVVTCWVQMLLPVIQEITMSSIQGHILLGCKEIKRK
jgi:hypothetical protein